MSAKQANRLVPSQKMQLNTSLANALRILRFDAAELTRYLEEQAAGNPYLGLTHNRRPAHEWSPRWQGAFAPPPQTGGSAAESVAAPDPSLTAHVTAEIQRLFPEGPTRQLAFDFLLALEPSGWIGKPLDTIATEAGVSKAEAAAVLRRLQQMEPTGLFACSLAECLRLQAVEAGLLDPVMDGVLRHLDLLAAGNTARLAQICATDEGEIALRLRRIRGFDPKPGSRFVQGAAPVQEPDLIARKTGTGWTVMLNRSALPSLEIGAAPANAAAPARRSIAAAKALERVVHGRNETLLAIAGAILARQPDLLDRGPEGLRPMTMAAIAEDLGHHESTISRAVAGVSIDTPHGVIWLRALFSSAPGEYAGKGDFPGLGASTGPSAAALRAQLARLIAAEDPQKPLSDLALTEQLVTGGAPLARRTVAKYRAMLNIPPAQRRKQRAARTRPGRDHGGTGANCA